MMYVIVSQTCCLWGDAEREPSQLPGMVLGYLVQDPPYPFQKVQLADGKDTGIILLIAPFYDLNYYKVWDWPHFRAI
jgi:hypothetical protein